MKSFKSILTVVLALLLMVAFTAPAMATGKIYADSQAAASAAKGAGLPGVGGKYAVITAVSLDGAAATADALFLVYDNETTTLLNAESSGQTALTIDECGSMADDTVLFIQEDANQPIWDVTVMSACNDTTNVATVTATDKAFSSGAYVYEMKTGTTWGDVGTTILNINSPAGMYMGESPGSPVAIIFNGSGGSILWISGTHTRLTD